VGFLGVLVAGSLLSAAAPTLPVLIAALIVAGFAAGMLAIAVIPPLLTGFDGFIWRSGALYSLASPMTIVPPRPCTVPLDFRLGGSPVRNRGHPPRVCMVGCGARLSKHPPIEHKDIRT
jgi:hypothetical protein